MYMNDEDQGYSTIGDDERLENNRSSFDQRRSRERERRDEEAETIHTS